MLGTRASVRGLSLLAIPLNVSILRALADEPKRLMDLRREAGSPPQTTLRKHLRGMTEIGALEKRRQNDFPGTLEYELGPAGPDLLAVAEVLTDWLAGSADGPLRLGDHAAKSVITALVEAWATHMLRALAARPLSLTELDDLISGVSYPSLERRLAAMRLAGLVEAVPSEGRGTPYAVTEWARLAVAPITAAVRWEQRYLREEVRPLGKHDAEAAFLLAVPMLRLPADLSGACRLSVEVQNGKGPALAGVLVDVEAGRIASCGSRLEGNAAAWASGSGPAWLRAVISRETGSLEMGGDTQLAKSFLDDLHGALFTVQQVTRTGVSPAKTGTLP
jgi:DNA-binding HxlR family transcriptional regulator